MERVGSIDSATPGALEFFAGIGLARIGLEAAGFRVTWANDFDPSKKAMYEAQFEGADDHVFASGDIGKITADELPRNAALAWALPAGAQAWLASGRERSGISSVCLKNWRTAALRSRFLRTSPGLQPRTAETI